MPEKTNFASIDRIGTKYMQHIESASNQAPMTMPETLGSNGLTAKKGGLPGGIDMLDSSTYIPSLPSSNQPAELVRDLHTRCKQLGISLFFKANTSVRTLGFTSAIAGEGKTFLAKLTAEAMAEENAFPVTLLECNWANPTLSSAYNFPPSPGLSEWLYGRCPLEAIRRRVTQSLTIIPCGDSNYNVSQLLLQLQQRGLQSVLADPNEIVIVDLPATLTTAYGPFLAQLTDLLILVVCMGVTPESAVADACHYLKDSRMHGIIFNQVASRIPRWLRNIL